MNPTQLSFCHPSSGCVICVILIKMFPKPLNSSLESPLFASLHLGIRHITTNSESMSTSLEEFPLIPGLELALAEKLICLITRFAWKRWVVAARVDEQWGFRFSIVRLSVEVQYTNLCHWKSPIKCLTSRSSGSLRRDGWDITDAFMTLSNARSNTYRANRNH